jgi:exopolyphosphatase/guanosine-5'-triphosphate,3'-diphosphate pyrophosphatase
VDGINGQEGKGITPAATERALTAVTGFQAVAEEFSATITGAVVTGVVRQAVNRREFLQAFRDQTGIDAKLISGEEEALLTALGVMSALELASEDVTVFDLGGGSTEFVITADGNTTVTSLPLGAAVLSLRFLPGDPPDESQFTRLSTHVDDVLQEAFPLLKPSPDGRKTLVGTGGTVTTLAAMIHRIDLKDITAARLNGLDLTRAELVTLFDQLKGMTLAERLKMPGLDRGRADVILGGAGAVTRILHCFDAQRMLVSLSDLLEGILIAFLQETADSSFHP